MQTDTPALEIANLAVHFGKRVAVDDISLNVAGGDVVALLGPNGAGKSTSLLAIAGAVQPAHGHVRVAGIDVAQDPVGARQRMGFADQPPSLYEFLTVAEQLEFVATARGCALSASNDVISTLGVDEFMDRLCRELSFGMRQRVGLAGALLGDLDLVLIDETLNGLDPRAAKAAREVIQAKARAGACVVMSTHLLGVVEQMADRIVIMNAGKIVTDIAGDELRDRMRAEGVQVVEKLYLDAITE